MTFMFFVRTIFFFFVFAKISLFAADSLSEKNGQNSVKKQADAQQGTKDKLAQVMPPPGTSGPLGPSGPPGPLGPSRPLSPPRTIPPSAGPMPGPSRCAPQGPSRNGFGPTVSPSAPSRSANPPQGVHLKTTCPQQDGYTVNFQDISIIELIKFISEKSSTNYIFDHRDLLYPNGEVIKVTIVSQEETSIEELSAALMQVLKMHNLFITEQGNNVLIYKNQNLSKVSTIITDSNINAACNSAVITRVFRLYNLDPERIRLIVIPLLSQDAIVEVSVETRHLIVTDITSNVDKIADLLTALDTPNAAFEIGEYQVRSGYPHVLVTYARDILEPLMQDNPLQLIAQPSSHKIFIVSTPYLINRAMEILSRLDHPEITEAIDMPHIGGGMMDSNFFMYKLKYQNGAEIADALRNIGVNLEFAGVVNPEFLSAVYSAQWVPVNNSIIVTGAPDAVEKVVELIDELDLQPKQVFIEVLIIDTTLENSLDFGVQWIALGDEQDKLAFASGLLSNVPPNPNLQGGPNQNPGARFVAARPEANPPTIPNPGRDVPLPQPAQLCSTGLLGGALNECLSSFGLGFIGNIIRHNGRSFLTLGALVSALDAELQTTVVLNPRVMVEDTQPADFFVGTNIPYQTTSTVIQQTGSVTQNIQYEDIGVQLRVVPTIAPNNIVTLQIDQSVVDVISLTTSNLLAPVTSKILASTRVHVPDGTFLVMSGHIRDVANCIHSGIPCLGTLPLIGPAFSRTIDSREKRNLIFFIRPKVVNDIEDGLRITNQEGYDYNWESHPCTLNNCVPPRAPECETYPPPVCPDH